MVNELSKTELKKIWIVTNMDRNINEEGFIKCNSYKEAKFEADMFNESEGIKRYWKGFYEINNRFIVRGDLLEDDGYEDILEKLNNF